MEGREENEERRRESEGEKSFAVRSHVLRVSPLRRGESGFTSVMSKVDKT